MSTEEVLKELLTAQEKRQLEFDEKDSFLDCTKKLLKRKKLEILPPYSVSNSSCIGCVWLYPLLLVDSKDVAVIAIHNYLRSFDQPHLIQQSCALVSSLYYCMTIFKLAYMKSPTTANETISTYVLLSAKGCLEAVQGLLETLEDQLFYMTSKKLAVQSGLSSSASRAVIAEANTVSNDPKEKRLRQGINKQKARRYNSAQRKSWRDDDASD